MQPAALFDLGAQLSFAATAALKRVYTGLHATGTTDGSRESTGFEEFKAIIGLSKFDAMETRFSTNGD